MELTRTCCFECDRMLRADSKQSLLSTFCFYFMVAGFTPFSLLPQVDKCSYGIPEIYIYLPPDVGTGE